MSPPPPASSSKHLQTIWHTLPREGHVSLPLNQLSASHDGEAGTGTTGTTLWLGAQVLACYLVGLSSSSSAASASGGAGAGTNVNNTIGNGSHSTAVANTTTIGISSRSTVLELGSGVGYLSLVLARLGYNVISTDIEPVLGTVLAPNIEAGLRVLRASTGAGTVFNGSSKLGQENGTGPEYHSTSRLGRSVITTPPPSTIGDIATQYLDWTQPLPPLQGDVDLSVVSQIITSDTIYHPDLIIPLFQTIASVSKLTHRPPTVYLALERRDSRMVDVALAKAREMGIVLKRIGHGRVVKSVNQSGWGWTEEDWEGVEIWKGRWKGGSRGE